MGFNLMMIVALAVIGVATGIISGMGLGGGTFLIPLLTIFLGFDQRLAQSINLFAFLPCAVISLIIHFKNHFVHFKVGTPLLLSGVVFAIALSVVTSYVDSGDMAFLFGVFLILIGTYQLASGIVKVLKLRRLHQKRQDK